MSFISKFLYRFTPRSMRRKARSGFSLVELLVVVGIIMLVAASSLLVLDQTDDQVRYDKTRQGYKELSAALFGPDMMTTIGGNLVISGYLADTGKLPEKLEDLLVRPATIPEWGPLVGPAFGGRIQHGWRGPYISQTSQTESGLSDSWGNPWRYSLSDSAVPPLQRYRPGYAPANLPPNIDLGSYGKNGLPNDVLLPPPTEVYDKDFPELGLTIGPGHFALTSVPIPSRTIQKQSADNITLYVGVVHAGVNMREAFVSQSAGGQLIYHPSLLRRANGDVVTVVVPGKGSTTVVAPTGSDKDKDKDKNQGGSTTVRSGTLDAGFIYNLGYARQLQLVLYDPNRGNAADQRLSAKLYIVDPVVNTYYPKVSSSGTEAVIQNSGTGPWLIP